MLRIIPRDEKYFEMFNLMSAHLVQGALTLRKLFVDFENQQDYANQIKNCEHQCDDLTHSIVTKLNRSFITPIDREDIYDLAGALDDVLDLIDATSSRTIIYNVEASTPPAIKLANVLYQAVEEVAKAVRTLGTKDSATPHFIEIHRLENEGDVLYREAVAHLFESATDPVYVIKWKELYEVLEKAIDKCEDAANVIEAIALKNA